MSGVNVRIYPQKHTSHSGGQFDGGAKRIKFRQLHREAIFDLIVSYSGIPQRLELLENVGADRHWFSFVDSDQNRLRSVIGLNKLVLDRFAYVAYETIDIRQ